MKWLSEKTPEFKTTILKDLIGELGEIGDILKQEINEKLEKIFRFK